jgi:hypothetical protein
LTFMRGFFPGQTGAWKTIDDARSFRRVSLSVVEMAVLTGVALRAYRATVVSLGAGRGGLYLGATFAAGFILLFGMATLHLGNFTVRQWVWRAPVFAAIEAATESAVSLGLIALGREPLGSERATFADWPTMARDVFVWRVSTVVAFALLLAGVVQLVRRILLKREHRDHTLRAVHEMTTEHKAEQ